MNISPAHWHLLLNHFPIVLSIIGTGFIIASFIIKKEHLKYASTILLIAAAISGFLAFQTGEGAEENIEGLAGVSESVIEDHESSANIGYRIIVGTGILALITLILLATRKKAAQIFLVVTLFASIASAAYLSYVGYTGGVIRHSEIRGDFGGQKNSPAPTNNEVGGQGDDDD